MRALNIVSRSLSQPSRQWGPQCCCCVPAKDRVAHKQLNVLLRAAATQSTLSTGAIGLAGLAAALLLCHASPTHAHIAITQPQQQQQAAMVQPSLPRSTAGFDPSTVGQIRGRLPAMVLWHSHPSTVVVQCLLPKQNPEATDQWWLSACSQRFQQPQNSTLPCMEGAHWIMQTNTVYMP
jgi:hypothetical protein